MNNTEIGWNIDKWPAFDPISSHFEACSQSCY